MREATPGAASRKGLLGTSWLPSLVGAGICYSRGLARAACARQSARSVRTCGARTRRTTSTQLSTQHAHAWQCVHARCVYTHIYARDTHPRTPHYLRGSQHWRQHGEEVREEGGEDEGAVVVVETHTDADHVATRRRRQTKRAPRPRRACRTQCAQAGG